VQVEGAGSRIRTDDLLITNQLLYQLSYAGKNARKISARLTCKQACRLDVRFGSEKLALLPKPNAGDEPRQGQKI
jgi:hypothetical protein